MLEDLKTFYYRGSPIIIPQWSDYIESLQPQKNELKRKFLNTGSKHSRATMLLLQIITQIDIEYALSLPDDITRYVNYFRFKEIIMTGLFDPVMIGRAYRKAFYRKGIYATTEYICPVDDVDHLHILPLDESWDSWSKVKPVTLWYHDTLEYSLNMLDDRVGFKFHQPKYAIIFIDAISLAFKWFKYKTDRTVPEELKNPYTFIHNEVLGLLFDDLQDIWLLNQVRLILDNVIEGKYKSYDYNSEEVKSVRDYGYKGGRYEEALTRLEERFILIKQGTLRPNNVLSSKLFNSGSIIDKIEYSFEYLDIPHLAQYKYLELLRDLPYLDIIFKMYELRPTTNFFSSLTKSLQYKINRLVNNKIWNRIYDPVIRADIKDYLLSFQKKIHGYLYPE